MTREEAIDIFEKQLTAAQVVLDSGFGSNPGENDFLYRRRKDMAEIALAALRPVSREQVERMKGVWIFNDDWWEFQCSKCHKGIGNIGKYKFCPHCGAPIADEAVEMVLKRMEEIYK